MILGHRDACKRGGGMGAFGSVSKGPSCDSGPVPMKTLKTKQKEKKILSIQKKALVLVWECANAYSMAVSNLCIGKSGVLPRLHPSPVCDQQSLFETLVF